MFYFHLICLGRKGKVHLWWRAAHGARLSTAAILAADVSEIASYLIDPPAPMALALSAPLCSGAVRVFDRKGALLLQASQDLHAKILRAFVGAMDKRQSGGTERRRAFPTRPPHAQWQRAAHATVPFIRYPPAVSHLHPPVHTDSHRELTHPDVEEVGMLDTDLADEFELNLDLMYASAAHDVDLGIEEHEQGVAAGYGGYGNFGYSEYGDYVDEGGEMEGFGPMLPEEMEGEGLGGPEGAPQPTLSQTVVGSAGLAPTPLLDAYPSVEDEDGDSPPALYSTNLGTPRPAKPPPPSAYTSPAAIAVDPVAAPSPALPSPEGSALSRDSDLSELVRGSPTPPPPSPSAPPPARPRRPRRATEAKKRPMARRRPL